MAGSFTYGIRLKSTATGGDGITIPVRGYTDLPVGLERPAVQLPPVRAGQSARVEVPIDLSPGVASADLIAVVPAGAPLRVFTLAPADQQPRLVIEWQGGQVIGFHRYDLGIKSARLSAAVAAPLCISVEVVPPIDTFPADLTMTAAEADSQWRRKIEIRTGSSETAPVVSVVDSILAARVKVSVTREGPGRYTAELVSTAPLKTTAADTEIRIRHEGAEASVRLLRLRERRE